MSLTRKLCAVVACFCPLASAFAQVSNDSPMLPFLQGLAYQQQQFLQSMPKQQPQAPTYVLPAPPPIFVPIPVPQAPQPQTQGIDANTWALAGMIVAQQNRTDNAIRDLQVKQCMETQIAAFTAKAREDGFTQSEINERLHNKAAYDRIYSALCYQP